MLSVPGMEPWSRRADSSASTRAPRNRAIARKPAHSTARCRVLATGLETSAGGLAALPVGGAEGSAIRIAPSGLPALGWQRNRGLGLRPKEREVPSPRAKTAAFLSVLLRIIKGR